MTPAVSPARADEFAAALQLIFHGRPAADALRALEAGTLDPSGLLVVRDEAGVAAAALAAMLPDGGAVVWPPRSRPGAADVTDLLAGHSVLWLLGNGAKTAQALLAPEETAAAHPLLAHGFSHVTTLWYLRHYLDLASAVLGAPDNLDLSTYAATDPALFRSTLARTYEGTQDFPELNGVRTPDEVLAGYQAEGFDPERWWLGVADGEPVGVLLVNPNPDWGGWEVEYVGVIPAARRRGHASELVRLALIEAKAAGVPYVSLAVDARNEPARELYRRLGFEPFDRREVFLAVWGGDAKKLSTELRRRK
jgi:ribosomal protein S18 acetylase RimI-like enzyme